MSARDEGSSWSSSMTESEKHAHELPSFCVRASKAHFRDAHGRVLMLRGVNATANAKTPVGQPGSKLEGFWEGAESGDMSFVGRILDIENGQADVHLGRLREWGFNTLRFLFTWEALEHKGPGQYDEDYIRYVIHMLQKCKAYGFHVYMDPHQDVFSRFSGGSGAPYWALIACGMNPRNFTVTGSAYLECEWPNPDAPDPASFPDMLWATNYTRLAVQTCNTLFWAGRDFAPLCVIDDINIQDWLQNHYFAAVRHLAEAIRAAGDLFEHCVIGWDSLNEPNEGYIGTHDLTVHDTGAVAILRIGPTPTAFQAMQLGMGEKLEVERWKFGPVGPKKDGTVIVDPRGKQCWLSPEEEPNGVSKWGWKRSPQWKLGQCIWAMHGVWDVEKKAIIRPDYFEMKPQSAADQEPAADFGRDYWRPHWLAYSQMIKEVHPLAIHFVQPPIFQIPPMLKHDIDALNSRACHSSHFYDGLTLVTKHWNWYNADALGMVRGKYSSIVFALRFGEAAIRRCIRDQLQTIRQDTFDYLGELPTMMGEIGIPFDLDKKAAYSTGDYHNQARALDASLNACDGPRPLNYTIWTYCPDNSHKWGDQWNGEDLSIWSSDDEERSHRQRTGTSRADSAAIAQAESPETRHKAALLAAPALTDVSPWGSTTSLPGLDTSDPATSTAPLNANRMAALSQRSDGGLLAALSPSQVDLPSTLSYLDLNDGARALPAFCRPYPVKVVGTPCDIQFDVKSSLFTLTVEVCYDDIAPDAPDQLATEIYMPLVHYAARPTAVSQAVRNDELPNEPRLKPISADEGRKLHLTRTKEPENARESPGSLDLEVDVNSGTKWSTDGQILSWYYPRPTSKGAKPMRYTLKAKRASGPIRTWQRQYGHDRMDKPVVDLLGDILQCPPHCTVS